MLTTADKILLKRDTIPNPIFHFFGSWLSTAKNHQGEPPNTNRKVGKLCIYERNKFICATLYKVTRHCNLIVTVPF